GGARFHQHGGASITIATALVFGLTGFIFLVPMPYHSHAEGVVWLPEQAMVRAGANGYFQDFLIEPGVAVVKGQALAKSIDPTLDAQLRQSSAKVTELEAEYAANFV